MINKAYYYISNSFYPFKNLATEEYFLNNVSDDEIIIFLWQNKKSVVIGRNQNAFKECNIHKLEEDGGFLVRRLSGGGAVFHDIGNLNFTFIASKKNFNKEKQTDIILESAKNFGLAATKSGRNDILIDEKKFSGNAYYESKQGCFHHGTVLIDANISNLSDYLNVSIEKLKSKSIDSVKSRVVNLKTYNENITVENFKDSILKSFSQIYNLTPTLICEERFDKKQIDTLEEKFLSDEWRFKKNLPFSFEFSKRFDWGEVSLCFDVKENIVQNITCFSDSINTDFFIKLENSLQGITCKVDNLVSEINKIETNGDFEIKLKKDILSLIKK